MVQGIILYNIELDGCLNGVYTNDYNDGIIFNEVAKLRPDSRNDRDSSSGITGTYDCFYFDKPSLRNNTELKIKLAQGMKGRYEFVWRDERNRVIFEGVGYIMNQRQIAVHYKQIDSIQ